MWNPLRPTLHHRRPDYARSTDARWAHPCANGHANNRPAMLNCKGAWKYDNGTIRIPTECGNSFSNFVSIAHTGRYQP
jgi:hypothetical protein